MAKATDTRLADLRVLAADDHAVNRDFIRAVLHERVAAMTLVDNGRDAIRAYEAGRFDVVLLDLHMPDVDGFSVHEAIATLEGRARPRVLALTADSRPEQRERLRQRGFHGLLHKPVSSALLLDAVAAVAASDGFVEFDEPDSGPAALLDDDDAARASGGHAQAQRMREALAAELAEHAPVIDRQIAAGAYGEAAEQLHRWAGAAGYAGARRFGEASARLEHGLRNGPAGSTGALYFEWRRTLAATTAALAAAARQASG